MPRVIWSQEAQLDLQRAYHFLADYDNQFAQRALRKIYGSAKLLEQRPELGRPTLSRRAARREFLVRFGRSGYILQHELVNGDVVILNVRHQRQATS